MCVSICILKKKESFYLILYLSATSTTNFTKHIIFNKQVFQLRVDSRVHEGGHHLPLKPQQQMLFEQ